MEARGLQQGGDLESAAQNIRDAQEIEQEARQMEEAIGEVDEASGSAMKEDTTDANGAATDAREGAKDVREGAKEDASQTLEDTHQSREAAVMTEAEARGREQLRETFVRRYTLDTRPWIPFHADAYAVTANVELSEGGSASYAGGDLLGLFNGQVQRIERAEGEAIVHSAKLLHAVTQMTVGTRYSLIIFFDRTARSTTSGANNRLDPPVPPSQPQAQTAPLVTDVGPAVGAVPTPAV